MTLVEAYAKWKDGETVTSIEMGGIGPGYEQAIQLGIWYCVGKNLGRTPPHWAPEVADEVLNICLLELDADNRIGGLSGAQAGAIKNVAYHFLTDGYEETLQMLPEDRRIQVRNGGFPTDIEWP